MKKERAIASARAALNCPFDIISNMLDLEPVKDWHIWKDSDGNSLCITKNNTARTHQSTKISNHTKDIFVKANPKLIIKHSYWGMLLSDNKDYIFIFLGNDGKLRCSYFINDIWIRNISPLLLGINILKHIASEYLETETRLISQLKILYPHDFNIEEAWSFGFPIENNDIQERVKCLLKTQNLTEK